MIEKTFQDEQDELLEYLIYNVSFPALAQPAPEEHYLLELYLTTDCNKQCEYCYLQKYKHELYPQEFNKPNIIVHNCQLLMDLLLEKQVPLKQIDIFSGEAVDTPLFYDILDILLDTINKGLPLKLILVPTNASFIETGDEAIERVQEYINKFQQIGTRLAFSISDDGMLLDDINRPLANNKQQHQTKELYYERMKQFCNRNEFGYHPMVNAHNIDKWCDNFNWWHNFLKEQGLDVLEHVMFLEVRNDEWTDEAIIEYLKLFKLIMETCYQDQKLNMDAKTFLPYLISIREGIYHAEGLDIWTPQYDRNYQPFYMACGPRISCALTQNLCIRLGDLAICPCHRLAYDHLLYGKFKVENDKIIGVHANNIQLYINSFITGYAGYMKCDVCPINDFCLKGCHGAQYEVNKEINYPLESVCTLQKAKVMYFFYWIPILLKKYNLTGFDHYLNIYKEVMNNLEQEDEEFYNKWITIIQNLPLEI